MNKIFQGDKSFSINKSSSLELWYCRPESEDKDGASVIEITFNLGTYHPNLASYKIDLEHLDA